MVDWLVAQHVATARHRPCRLLRTRARAVMLDLVSRAYGERLALEWRATVAVAVLAVAGVASKWLSRSAGDAWLLVVLGAIVAIGLVLLVRALQTPTVPPPQMPRRFGYDFATTAAKRVRRGEPVDPPELQEAAVDGVRRGLRISHLTFGWAPVMGAAWALRISEPGFVGGFGYVGVAMMLLGISGLVWSGVVQGRLDRLENTGMDGSYPPLKDQSEFST